MGKATLIKALKGAETVAGEIPRVTTATRQPSVLPGLDLLDEYNKTAPTPRVGIIEDEIVQQSAAQTELTRLQKIKNPTAEPSTFYQAADADEFKVRYNEQLKNPTYSVKSAIGHLASGDLEQLVKSQGEHITMRNNMMHRLRKNERWGKRYDEWVGDSAYKDEVFFHVDKWTDPTRPNSFVQFEDPLEMGLHAGTANAANRFVGFGGVEGAMQVQGDFAQSLDELAGLADIDPKELHRIVAREIEAKFQAKFTRGQQPDISDDWVEIMGKIDERVGTDAGDEAQAILSRMKEFPTPSTTPMVFKGRNGLLMQDLNANFRPEEVGRQLEDIFPDDADAILAASSGTRAEKTKKLQDFIESKGYDHIIYHNAVEDRGSLSIINWNPDLQRSVYDMELAGASDVGGASAQAQAFIGMLGIGGGGAALQQDE